MIQVENYYHIPYVNSKFNGDGYDVNKNDITSETELIYEVMHLLTKGDKVISSYAIREFMLIALKDINQHNEK